MTLGIWIITLVYATWIDLPTQESWNPLTKTIWNDLVNKVNDIWRRTDNIYSTGGNIGIWITNPLTSLDWTTGLWIYNNISPGLSISNANKGYLLYLSSADSNKFKIWDSTLNVDRLTIDATGNVWIWTTTPYPDSMLDVNGIIRARNGLLLQYGSVLKVNDPGCPTGYTQIACGWTRCLCWAP